MFGLFKKGGERNNRTEKDFSCLLADMHAHILPGIDDGAATLDDAIDLVRRMQSMGYTKVIATPHISTDFYPNTPDIISDRLDFLREALRSVDDITISIDAGAEYMIDDHFLSLLHNGQRLMPIHNTYILFEMGFVQEHPLLQEAIFAIQTAGFKPLLAHPERYTYYHSHDEDFWKSLKSRGCLLQVNVLSLSGYYGKSIKEKAWQLLKGGFYDFCGTDIHHVRHCTALQQFCSTGLYAKLSDYDFLNKTLA